METASALIMDPDKSKESSLRGSFGREVHGRGPDYIVVP